MSRMGFGVLALLALVSCIAFTSGAQARWAPGGSYTDTCRHIRYDGSTLTATCQERDGGWRNTWLPDADNCDGSIANNDGQLECGFRRDRDWGHSDGGPSGSYERSCTNIRMDGYTLKATCQRRDGSWRWTSLEDAYDCNGRIANFNGQLVCGRGRR